MDTQGIKMTNMDDDNIDVCVQALEIGMFDHVIDGLTTVLQILKRYLAIFWP